VTDWHWPYQPQPNDSLCFSWTPAIGEGGSLGRDAWLLAENVYLEDGQLVLRSLKDDYGFNFTTGAVTSLDKANSLPLAFRRDY
jgi:hypothetical protein